MFRIGDFSKLSQVSIKALHHYDELDLFKPLYVDELTGYRYYMIEQMPRLNRILVLKDLGFSLEQIALMLDGELSPTQLKEMLESRRTQVLQQIRSEQEKLTRIEARMDLIARGDGGSIPAYDVVLKSVAPQTAFSLRQILPNYISVGALFQQARAACRKAHAKPNGPAFSIYHNREYRVSDIDIEAVIPVIATNLSGFSQVPGVEQMACVIHQGLYTSISSAYEALMQWIAANDYQISGFCREVYLVPDDEATDHAQIFTEVQIPVIKQPGLRG